MHPYGIHPDWYNETLNPNYVPVPPDAAHSLYELLTRYVKHYPRRCTVRTHESRLFSTVDCLLPGLGTVSYLYKENVCLTVFLTSQDHDYERVYRYLFLDQISEEETYAVRHIRTHIEQELERSPQRLGAHIQVCLDGEVLPAVVVGGVPEPR